MQNANSANYFIAFDSSVNELGRAETLSEAKKFPDVTLIDMYDNRGRWVKCWELRGIKGKRWVIKLQ